MGIYDRDYYRREGPSYLGSFIERGRMCKWLIAINVGFFIIQLVTLPDRHREVTEDGEAIVAPAEPSLGPFTDALILDADKVLHGQVWRLLSHAFLHAPSMGGLPMHILFNMLFLWWFGSDVEDLYGPKEFVAFYLTAAVFGGIAYVLAWKAGLQPGKIALGASGAVTAVLVLCAIHYPTRIIYMFWFMPVPIWLFVIFQVAQDTLGLLSHSTGGVGVSAHLGGAAFGFIYHQRHWRLLNVWNVLSGTPRQLFRPKLRIYREEPRKPVSVGSHPAGDGDEQLEAKLDAILEKVARHGKSSLTESENQLLMRASEIYKRRRT
jgi:membrane associated rhomboid family serine protease